MQLIVVDSQTIGETESPIFGILQNGVVSALITLVNKSTNTANYRFQQLVSGNWADMSSLGTDLNNTLSPSEVKTIKLLSSSAQVQMVGNASGGTEIEFSVVRYSVRLSGGLLPLLPS